MKERILEALRAKFPGRNANILGRIADKLAGTTATEEQVTTAVEGVTAQLLEVIESYGDSRATEATTTAVANYETKHGLKDGKPATESTPNHTPGGGQGSQTAPKEQTDEVPAWAKALTERLDKMEGQRTSTERRSQLAEIYTKLPEPLRKPYERINLDTLSAEDFATLKGEITSEVDALAQTLSSKGAVFGTPSSRNGAGSAPAKELSQAQQEAIARREGIPSTDSQPF
ncbi:hypothetical protein [Porphyromonas sp. oral taxon 275]|uniref:hypothetical protein n=1 Tax=Porphyromonas sp. oral taxon 275 TaxID=712435 RepID=UPI001BA48E1B|nr:hypothetical protein [Porphyromonas sp. oral taxon 275]QUB42569.1 hypothetical protein J4862_06075 [Porphyromonas sp. oral taxon 275]